MIALFLPLALLGELVAAPFEAAFFPFAILGFLFIGTLMIYNQYWR